jgi:hypothetical protein
LYKELLGHLISQAKESNTEKKKKKKTRVGGDRFKFLSHASIPKDIL